ncbi:MAG: hypothetical protein AAGA68_26685 [Pseudomonadota bacterium]
MAYTGRMILPIEELESALSEALRTITELPELERMVGIESVTPPEDNDVTTLGLWCRYEMDRRTADKLARRIRLAIGREDLWVQVSSSARYWSPSLSCRDGDLVVNATGIDLDGDMYITFT